MGEITYGIIGTGMMGVEHIMNINAIEGATVTALSDTNTQSLHAGVDAVVADAPPAAFTDHRELMASGLCDAVVVATPNFTHVDVLLDLMTTDLNVLVEKPLCTTVEDCDRIIEAQQDRSGITWVGLEYRYMPPVARLIEDVHGGTIGELRMLAIREHRFPFLPKVDDWNRLRANTGGTLVEKCCHYFDLMNHITGATPVRVMASGGQDVNHLDEYYSGTRSDIIDNAYVIVEYDSGVRTMLDLCMFAESGRNQEEVVAVGSIGKLESHLPSSEYAVGRRGGEMFNPSIETVHNPAVRYEGIHHGSSYLEHLDFIDAIATGTEPKVSLEDGRLSVAIGVAAHRSIDEERVVDMAEVL